MAKSPDYDLCDQLNFRDPEKQNAHQVNKPAQYDPSQRGDPAWQSGSSQYPEPESDAHDKGSAGTAEKPVQDATPLNSMQASSHDNEQRGCFQCRCQ